MAEHRFYRAISDSSRRFRAMLPRARDVQTRRLRKILSDNARSEFGRKYRFDSIDSPRAYRDRVPIAEYQDFVPYIERLANGESGLLTEQKLVAFEETGGSTAGAKLIPVTEALLESFRRAIFPWLDDLALAFPAITRGRSYHSISPVARASRATSGGIPIGLQSDATYLGELAGAFAETLAVSPAVSRLQNIDRWRDATCAQLEVCEDLAMISVWSPTFLLEFLDRVDFGRKPLNVISCWDQAGSRPWAETLRKRLPGVRLQGKGLLATEGVVSIPLEGLSWPVMAVDSGFFEFRDAGGATHEATDLRISEEYEILMTTEGGFYRYAIGDRIRVHGFAGEAPLLEFIGRTAAVDLCGEKLTEAFVMAALAPIGLKFALLSPAASKVGYVLTVDADEVGDVECHFLAQRVEHALQTNPQYAYACRLGQLAPLTVLRRKRPLHAWLQGRLARGQRLGDIKPPVLSHEPI